MLLRLWRIMFSTKDNKAVPEKFTAGNQRFIHFEFIKLSVSAHLVYGAVTVIHF